MKPKSSHPWKKQDRALFIVKTAQAKKAGYASIETQSRARAARPMTERSAAFLAKRLTYKGD
jgi:hypothetical protein